MRKNLTTVSAKQKSLGLITGLYTGHYPFKVYLKIRQYNENLSCRLYCNTGTETTYHLFY